MFMFPICTYFIFTILMVTVLMVTVLMVTVSLFRSQTLGAPGFAAFQADRAPWISL